MKALGLCPSQQQKLPFLQFSRPSCPHRAAYNSELGPCFPAEERSPLLVMSLPSLPLGSRSSSWRSTDILLVCSGQEPGRKGGLEWPRDGEGRRLGGGQRQGEGLGLDQVMQGRGQPAVMALSLPCWLWGCRAVCPYSYGDGRTMASGSRQVISHACLLWGPGRSPGGRGNPQGQGEALCGIKRVGCPWFVQEGVPGSLAGRDLGRACFSRIRRHSPHGKKGCG